MKSELISKKARVISFNPDGEYYFQKGMAAYQKGDLRRACKYIERAIVFKPNEVEYLCQQAAILTELEEYEASTALLKKVIYELDDKVTECHFFMANNYAYLGQFYEALQEVKTYLSLEPNGLYGQEADELFRLLLSEAGDDFEEEASYISAHERGRRALEHGHYAEAMSLFRKVIKEKPDFWAAQNNLAIAYFSMGLSEKALDILHHVLKYDGGNIHALCNMATFYFQMNNNQEKLKETLGRLDKLYPYFPEHCGKLGSTYLFIGEYDHAFRWLTAAEKKKRVHGPIRPFIFGWLFPRTVPVAWTWRNARGSRPTFSRTSLFIHFNMVKFRICCLKTMLRAISWFVHFFWKKSEAAARRNSYFLYFI
ncbi:tetratricopeptide repeat protein [Terrilactibacillus sp. S3-3]|nr:tetratricopeptide repeat protein [Terrilactibacillus sp. S3-3]